MDEATEASIINQSHIGLEEVMWWNSLDKKPLTSTEYLIGYFSRLPNIFTRGELFCLWDMSCSDDGRSPVHRESKQQTKVLLSLHSVAPGSLI